MSEKFKILIADNLENEGLEILQNSQIFDIDFRKKTSKEELLEIIPNIHGLIIRSASKVTPEILEKATKLKVVIRAGVGVDNINIPACSQKGVVVMNAPAGNAISTAEQAIALMFGLARNIPQANASMKDKQWEKTKFKGTQITGKTIGIVGLGRIGKEVAKRAKGLGMKVLGYDPYIPKENLEYLQIPIVSIETILAESDFITVHTPLTNTTENLVNSKNIHTLKKGVRLINCARGGIYEEAALIEGLKSGHLGGVGLDVFSEEPPPADLELYNFENCVMTPHLGASTDEAQAEVAKESAEAMVAYFKTGVARNSLNFPTIDPKEMDILTPWFDLCEKIGQFASQFSSKPIVSANVSFYGSIIDLNLKPLEIAITKGLLQISMGDEVNLVNAPFLAKERKLEVSVKKDTNENISHKDLLIASFYNGDETLEFKATVGFSGGSIISINNMSVEFKPEGHILFIKNQDRPKVVGEIGVLLGEANINIASLQLGREAKGGVAVTIIQLDSNPSNDVVLALKKKDFIIDVKQIIIL